MTTARPQRDTETRLRVFRESDFAEDEGPTPPGGLILASGTGTTIRVRPGFAVLEGRPAGRALRDTEPMPVATRPPLEP